MKTYALVLIVVLSALLSSCSATKDNRSDRTATPKPLNNFVHVTSHGPDSDPNYPKDINWDEIKSTFAVRRTMRDRQIVIIYLANFPVSLDNLPAGDPQLQPGQALIELIISKPSGLIASEGNVKCEESPTLRQSEQYLSGVMFTVEKTYEARTYCDITTSGITGDKIVGDFNLQLADSSGSGIINASGRFSAPVTE
jgi:hypothetical protein